MLAIVQCGDYRLYLIPENELNFFLTNKEKLIRLDTLSIKKLEMPPLDIPKNKQKRIKQPKLFHVPGASTVKIRGKLAGNAMGA